MGLKVMGLKVTGLSSGAQGLALATGSRVNGPITPPA